MPLMAAGIIVVGNIFSSFSIWGFDYHVLHLPYGSTLQLWSNLIVIALAIFPLVSSKEGWHHYAYIVLAIFALALLSRNLSFNIYVLLFLGSEGVRDETGSIFFTRTSQRITYTILIVYLLWSLSLASVVRREIGLIFIALAMSAVVSGNYMVDIAKRRQEAGGGILTLFKNGFLTLMTHKIIETTAHLTTPCREIFAVIFILEIIKAITEILWLRICKQPSSEPVKVC